MHKIGNFFRIILNIKVEYHFEFFIYLDEQTGEIVEDEITGHIKWIDKFSIRSTTRNKAQKLAWCKVNAKFPDLVNKLWMF